MSNSSNLLSDPAVGKFLSDFGGPLRIATNTESGFPVICSLWYQHQDELLLCATQRDSLLVQHLERDSRCAFELSVNEAPYYGLRGRGVAEISSDGAEDLLEALASRYLGDEDTPFRAWLRSRVETEVCIRISPTWITTWDYRQRMNASDKSDTAAPEQS